MEEDVSWHSTFHGSRSRGVLSTPARFPDDLSMSREVARRKADAPACNTISRMVEYHLSIDTTPERECMRTFTKRVQVLFSPREFSRLQAIAREQGESLGALIRKAVETVYLKHEEQARLDAVQRMAAMRLPVTDWEQMERESMPGNNLG